MKKIKTYYISWLAVGCIGVALLVLSVFQWQSEVSLDRNGMLVESEVINWRTSYDKNSLGKNYDIQYQFKVPNDSIKYSKTDFTGRENLWVELTLELWNKTKESKKITITYDSQNPWNHKLENEFNEDIYWSLIVGLIFLMVSLWKIFTLRFIKTN